MFVHPHHKQRFLQTCADLMGLPTSDTQLLGLQEKSPTKPLELASEAPQPGGVCQPAPPPCLVSLLAIRKKPQTTSDSPICRPLPVRKTQKDPEQDLFLS